MDSTRVGTRRWPRRRDSGCFAQVSSVLQGHSDVVSADFAPAFVAVALVSAVSVFFHATLPADAGAEVSGHGRGR
ncbi:MAG TPA: hypothetical protein VEL09_11435 [Burkholderiales bacterium]|nr:hypothetical protein [Burkholderiales bacterium]